MSERKQREKVHGVPIFRREEGGNWYGDFRTLGGGRESLGTAEREAAEDRLYARRQELRDGGEEPEEDRTLYQFCDAHLRRKRQEVATSTYQNEERSLGYLVEFLRRRLDHEPTLQDVTAARLEAFRDWRLDNVKASTVGVELSCISSMLKRALARRLVDRNEVKHVRRPRTEAAEAVWLETGEAARVLEAARKMEEDPSSRCYGHLYALVAAFLLTGGRRQEVFGLQRRDVDLQAGTVHFRPNQRRSLKNDQSRRTVPLWPQLREIVAPHLEREGGPSALLFPARDGGMLTTLRWALSTLEDRAKLEKHLTLKVFRHTYTATRIQTLDGGEPVSLFTVACELGHKGVGRIEDTYGHLQERRSRLSEVRYREGEIAGHIGEEGADATA